MAKKAVAKKAEKEEKEEAAKYGVEDLAKELDVSPGYARVLLRKNEVEKLGKAYGWNTDKEFNAVVKQLKVKEAA